MPPKKAEQSIPPTFKRCVIKQLVVVFPCVPATAMQNMPLEMMPKTSERLKISNPLFLK